MHDSPSEPKCRATDVTILVVDISNPELHIAGKMCRCLAYELLLQPDLDIKTRDCPFTPPQQTPQPTQPDPRTFWQYTARRARIHPPLGLLKRSPSQRRHGLVDRRLNEISHALVPLRCIPARPVTLRIPHRIDPRREPLGVAAAALLDWGVAEVDEAAARPVARGGEEDQQQ